MISLANKLYVKFPEITKKKFIKVLECFGEKSINILGEEETYRIIADFLTKQSVRVGKKASRGMKKEDIISCGLNPIISNFLNIDATSASVSKLEGKLIKKDFSPMFLGPTRDGCLIFENWWQYNKVYPDIDHINSKQEITHNFFEFRKKGYSLTKGHRHPPEINSGDYMKNSKGEYIYVNGKRKTKYYTPIFSYDNGNRYTYIQARKKMYVPEYAYLVKKTNSFQILKKMVDNGKSVQILDYDGPEDTEEGSSLKSRIITRKLLKEKIEDPTAPFGHGYVLAGLLAGIEPEEYCD